MIAGTLSIFFKIFGKIKVFELFSLSNCNPQIILLSRLFSSKCNKQSSLLFRPRDFTLSLWLNFQITPALNTAPIKPSQAIQPSLFIPPKSVIIAPNKERRKSLMKDTLFKSDYVKGEFRFDARVAEVFDDMLSRSVPFYEEVQRIIANLATAR